MIGPIARSPEKAYLVSSRVSGWLAGWPLMVGMNVGLVCVR